MEDSYVRILSRQEISKMPTFLKLPWDVSNGEIIGGSIPKWLSLENLCLGLPECIVDAGGPHGDLSSLDLILALHSVSEVGHSLGNQMLLPGGLLVDSIEQGITPKGLLGKIALIQIDLDLGQWLVLILHILIDLIE